MNLSIRRLPYNYQEVQIIFEKLFLDLSFCFIFQISPNGVVPFSVLNKQKNDLFEIETEII